MFNSEIDYTLMSTDSEHYNRIDVSLSGPPTRMAKMIVSSLTTNCNIVLLNKDDYIRINGVKYSFDDEYTDLSNQAFLIKLNEIIQESSITANYDNAGRIKFIGEKTFTILDCSYNVMLLTGFYSETFPLISQLNGTAYEIISQSVGYTLSTPILYLVSNVGNHSYRPMGRLSVNEKIDNEISSSKIVMRLNNSFSANYPIVVNNGDFQTDISTNELSNIQFTLIDANMKEIKLLNPMYITVKIEPIPDEEFLSEIILSSQYKKE